MNVNHSLEELEALFEEDDDILTDELSVNVSSTEIQKSSGKTANGFEDEEDIAEMKTQYEELQKKLFLLQEKINSKQVSPQICDDLHKTSLKETSSATKRKFLSAFDFSIDDSEEIEKPSNNTDSSTFTNSPIQKINDNSSSQSKFYSSEKKKRNSHCNENASFKPLLPTLSKTQNHSSKIAASVIPQSKTLPQSCNNAIRFEVEYFSRIRLKHRYIDELQFKQRMEGKMFLKLSLLRPTLSIAEDKDWVSIGVVAKQLDPMTAKNGKRYSIWHLTDLDDCTKHVSLFLFGKILDDLWKNITIGTVIALLNPSIMPPKKDNNNSGKNYDNTPALTVDVAERVMKIGVAADLGWCTATKFRNKQPAGKCLAYINKKFGDVCIYHMQTKHRKMSSKRGELQGNSAPGIPLKYKNTLWNKVKGDQFFYGGQVFSATPPTVYNHQSRKESKMKLTDILTKSEGVSSLNQKNCEIERSRILEAISGIKGKQSISGCSDKFAEMLSSGDMVAGSRQFLNHLQKKKLEAEKKQTSIVNPSAQLLKQQKESTNQQNQVKQVISNDTASSFLKERMITIQHQKIASVETAIAKKNHTNKLFAKQQMSSTRPQLNKKISKTSLNNSTAHKNLNSVTDASSTLNKTNHTATDSAMQSSKNKVEVNLQDARDLLLKMKRERYLKLNPPNTNLSSNSVQSTSSAINVPQLGCNVSKRSEIDLSGDWLSKRCSNLSVPSLAELRKRKAIAKLRNESGLVEIKNPDPNNSLIGVGTKIATSIKLQEKVLEKVEENRKDLTESDKENSKRNQPEAVLSKNKMNSHEFNCILNASSSHTNDLDVEEMEKQEKYFNPLIKKEMMELKMAETYEISSKVVTCDQCNYTFWLPHERCKQLHHTLNWRNVKKRFFECNRCKRRTTTWDPYPLKPCRDCGSEKLWKKTTMWKDKSLKSDSDTLLIRGVEHSKFLNSLQSGVW